MTNSGTTAGSNSANANNSAVTSSVKTDFASSTNSDDVKPSIFTPPASFVRRPTEPPQRSGELSASIPRTSSPFRRQSTPNCLDQGRIQAAAAVGESAAGVSLGGAVGSAGQAPVEEGSTSLKPVLSLATSHPQTFANSIGSALGSGKNLAGAAGVGQSSLQESALNSTSVGNPSIWASLASADRNKATGSSPSSQFQRPRSAKASKGLYTKTPPGGVPSSYSPRTRDTSAAHRLNRPAVKRAAGSAPEPSTSEPATKRPRFRGPKSKHTLDSDSFGPGTFNEPALQPPSPLFFSNSPRPRPQLPPRFSSSEAGARMLSKARTEDSHIKTVSLARGTIVASAAQSWPSWYPTSALRSEGSHRMSLDRSTTARSSSPDGSTSGLEGSMGGLLSSIGVTELLELDERPTFIVDLGESSNYGSGALHLVFANPSLRSFPGMYELVTGVASEESGAGLKTYMHFKSWLLSASVNGESLNVCLPGFNYAGVQWSCSTLRKRLRIISGAFTGSPPPSNAPASSSLPPASITSGVPGDAWIGMGGDIATEPTDYFAGVVRMPTAAVETPTPEARGTSRGVIPTIEQNATLNAAIALPAMTSTEILGIDLLPSTHAYVPPSQPAALTPDRPPMIHKSSSGSIDSLGSQIPLAPSDAPSFDWTRIPVTDAMPRHIQFARSVDWASTALGPIERWSSDLRQMCNLIMASPHPAAMYWGEDLIAIYNEAYVLLAGQKHPWLMGRSYREAWVEIWDEVKDVFANAKHTGEATMKDDDCLFMNRNSYLEETYFSWSIIPMVGRDGSVMGLYNPAFEKTRRKIAERRMLTLREVGERTASARDVKGFWAQVEGSFEFNEYDSPFLLLYSVADEVDSDASSIYSNSVNSVRQCTLEGHLGVPEGHAAAPKYIDLKQGMEGFGPVFREVMSADKPVLLEVGSRDLPEDLLEGLENRGFGDPVRAVVVCPIHPTTGESILGFLVLGVNPRRPYDDDYSLFVQLLSRQLATSLASVVLFEEEIRRGQKAAKLAALERIELSEQLAHRTQEAIESETKFTRMAEFAPVGMFIADQTGRITFANDAWYEISRVPKTGTIEKAADMWMESVADDDRELISRIWSDLVEQKKPVTSEVRFKAQWEDRKSGVRSDTWVLFSAYPEKWEDGRLKSVFGSITNISQQKWAEGIQTRKMEEAVELKRQQENFIDITSHEMRNPLSAILQCSDEIASSLTKFRQGEDRVMSDDLLSSCLDAAQIISLCSQHQKRIVDDILTLSKLDSALLLVTPVDAQPLTVVQRALKMHEGELQAADIQMKFMVDQSYRDLGLDWVKLDPSRVLQVLINLTTNAIKFTGTEKKRTITVTIGASAVRPSDVQDAPVKYFPTRSKRQTNLNERDWGDGDVVYIHFSVKDTGRGLNPEEKKMLFMRFSQASPRTHVQYGGSGLGLFISRELTELQGGEIGVESEAGKGSTFAFYIAARKSTAPPGEADGGTGIKRAVEASGVKTKSLPSAVAATNHKLTDKSGTPTSADQKPLQRTVLIVEDNLVNQRVLQKQLKNQGITVHLANHGGEALEKLKQSTYWAGDGSLAAEKLGLDIILMDLEMPVMDGLTCTRRIRELELEGKLTGHVPIIAVTANARAEQVKTALEAGMDDVVSKPFRIPELVPKIGELMLRYPMPSASNGPTS
ncbi:Motif C-terminal to PAS motifs [Teratosphaeria destructans]|uniref:Motif C-terminal to PAS motifs n=1 Tax=Teratosphaeria destructans TaxID=418781 RepID=A0A9W7VZ57_9PEZI|nr:Motif C-terminal to PAS motifs [Teratosphaeria destructans]